jgi:hypothetical protein
MPNYFPSFDDIAANIFEFVAPQVLCTDRSPCWEKISMNEKNLFVMDDGQMKFLVHEGHVSEI